MVDVGSSSTTNSRRSKALSKQSIAVQSSISPYIQVLQVALTHGNYDLVRRLLSKTNHQPGFLCCQLPILQDAVCGYAGSKTFGLSSEEHPLPEIIGSLLKHGALIDTRDTNGKSPLLCACELGYPRTFDVLLEAGADVQETTLGNGTDAQHAPRTTNLLQVALARFRKSVHMWPVPSYWAQSLKTGFPYVILRLLDLGLRTDASDSDLVHFFHVLCFQGNLDNVDRLLRIGVDLGVQDPCADDRHSYGSALHAVVDGGNTETLSLLLSKGMNPRTKAFCGTGHPDQAQGSHHAHCPGPGDPDGR